MKREGEDMEGDGEKAQEIVFKWSFVMNITKLVFTLNMHQVVKASIMMS